MRFRRAFANDADSLDYHLSTAAPTLGTSCITGEYVFCVHVLSFSYTTWAGKNATFGGNSLTLMPMMLASTFTDDDNNSNKDDDNNDDNEKMKKDSDMPSMFERAILLFNNFHQLRPRQCAVHHKDRLLFPSLSVYELRRTQSPFSASISHPASTSTVVVVSGNYEVSQLASSTSSTVQSWASASVSA